MKTNTNTNWSQPNTNIFAALLSLRQALASGHKAELIRLYNEECSYPIKVKDNPEKVDFRQYKFTIGYISSYNKITEENCPWNKHLTLNYKACYGTQDAVKLYYETGVLSDDNLKGIGKCHLVKVDDLIKFYSNKPDAWSKGKATELYAQYRDPATHDMSFWFDFFAKEHGNEWSIKKFNHKLWVVNQLDESESTVTPLALRILNIPFKPLYFIMKYIPKKSVLTMKEYKIITYRIGGVINGFSLELHIPNKFGFK